MRYLLFLVGLLLTGCSTNSLLRPYPVQLADARQAIGSGQYGLSLAELNEQTDSADGLLYLMEHGRLAQLKGDIALSLESFKRALALFEQQQNAARIRVGRLLGQTGSLLTNDNALPYQGAVYEQLLLHCFQAYNYLSLKRPDSALVELRQAYEQQQEARRLHQTEMEQAQSEARRYVSDQQMQQLLKGLPNSMSATAAAGFNSGYVYLLSALLYETQGNPNEALIDYQRALELYPTNPYLQQDRYRLAVRLNRRDLLASSHASSVQIRPRSNQGRLVVVIEQGLVPSKQSIQLPLFLERGYQQLTLPYYPSEQPLVPPVIITPASGSRTAALIEQVHQLAASDLSEQLPKLVVRQLARMYAKGSLQRQMSRNMGIAGDVASILYTLVSEQADLRSWLTLPNAVFYSSSFEPAGIVQLYLQHEGKRWPIEAQLLQGRTLLIRVVVVGQRLQQQIFQL